jgi:6-phosphogluconolactonase
VGNESIIGVTERAFADRQALARALASAVAEDLRAAITERGQATLAVSGGHTPRRFLELLGQQMLPWQHVTVTVTDDRWVPAGDTRSNERLLRETLMIGAAAVVRLVPLYVDAPDPESGIVQIAANVAKLILPFDALVLGMGADGHCASLFADGDHIQAALQPDGLARVISMRAPSAGEPRVSLTLSALLSTRSMYVHIESDKKRKVLAQAMRGEAQFSDAPVRAVLSRARTTPSLYWCP